MLRHNTRYIFLIIIVNSLSISTAQLNNNHALLPTLKECGRLHLDEFEDRTGTVQPNEFPWMAQIAYTDSRTSTTSYRCSAVLINQRYLLAVAHCLESSGNHEAYAVVLGGSVNNTAAPLQLDIDEIVVHRHFNVRERANNIALLRMNQTISYTREILPICLPGPKVKGKEFGAEQLIVAGWYLRADPWNMHKLPVVVSNTLDCRRKYFRVLNITEEHLCGITCFQRNQYRSGSALMDIVARTNYYLAGLLSAGRSICTYPEEPDVFTRVDRYMDWIRENIAD